MSVNTHYLQPVFVTLVEELSAPVEELSAPVDQALVHQLPKELLNMVEVLPVRVHVRNFISPLREEGK